MTGARITFRIDRVVVDQPGVTRGDLDRALRDAITAHLAVHGTAAFVGGARATVPAHMPRTAAPLPTRIASAAVKAVTS